MFVLDLRGFGEEKTAETTIKSRASRENSQKRKLDRARKRDLLLFDRM